MNFVVQIRLLLFIFMISYYTPSLFADGCRKIPFNEKDPDDYALKNALIDLGAQSEKIQTLIDSDISKTEHLSLSSIQNKFQIPGMIKRGISDHEPFFWTANINGEEVQGLTWNIWGEGLKNGFMKHPDLCNHLDGFKYFENLDEKMLKNQSLQQNGEMTKFRMAFIYEFIKRASEEVPIIVLQETSTSFYQSLKKDLPDYFYAVYKKYHLEANEEYGTVVLVNKNVFNIKEVVGCDLFFFSENPEKIEYDKLPALTYFNQKYTRVDLDEKKLKLRDLNFANKDDVLKINNISFDGKKHHLTYDQCQLIKKSGWTNIAIEPRFLDKLNSSVVLELTSVKNKNNPFVIAGTHVGWDNGDYNKIVKDEIISLFNYSELKRPLLVTGDFNRDIRLLNFVEEQKKVAIESIAVSESTIIDRREGKKYDFTTNDGIILITTKKNMILNNIMNFIFHANRI